VSFASPVLDSLSTSVQSVHDVPTVKKLSDCHKRSRCQLPFCVWCISWKAWRERDRLRALIPRILAAGAPLQVWFLSAATSNSPAIKTHAIAAVDGINRLLLHSRLVNRVVASFSAVEIGLHLEGNVEIDDPFVHIHMIIVTRPIRISQPEWNLLWAASCPLARKMPPGVEIRRRRASTKYRHQAGLPMVVEPIWNADMVYAGELQTFEQHLERRISYATGWANPQLLKTELAFYTANPTIFIQHRLALKGTKHFAGNMCRNQKKKIEMEAADNLLVAQL